MSEEKKDSEQSTNESGKKFSIYFSDIWKGLVKFWWLLLVLGILCCSILFFKGYFAFVPKYEVSATFTVNTQTMTLDGEGLPSYSYYYDNTTATQLADTFPYILSSNLLTDAIKNDLGMNAIPATLTAKAVSTTNMFIMTASGTDAKKTYDVLLSAMDNYPSAAKFLVGNVMLTVISPPAIPEEPVNKFTYTTALEGFGIGIAIGAALIFLYVIVRRTIKTKKEVNEQLKLEVVAILPEVTFKKYKKLKIDRTILITNEKIGNGFLEATRIYRNSFINMLKEGEQTVMVTSTAPSEGKTTAIINLALSLKDVGKKILVVDSDLRNPSVSGALQFDSDQIKYDIEEKLYSIAYLEDYGISYLKFNSGENDYWTIINTEYLKNLFNELKKEYDYILVDTPPCGLISDTLVVANACDCALYVILQDTIRVRKILNGVDSLMHTDVRLLGAVINGAQSGLAGYGENYGYGYGSYGHYKNYSRYGYGYGYGYGYEYGYGYGYGEEKSESSKKDKKEKKNKKDKKDKK